MERKRKEKKVSTLGLTIIVLFVIDGIASWLSTGSRECAGLTHTNQLNSNANPTVAGPDQMVTATH